MEAANYNDDVVLHSYHKLALLDGILYKLGVNEEFHPAKSGVCLPQENPRFSLCVF